MTDLPRRKLIRRLGALSGEIRNLRQEIARSKEVAGVVQADQQILGVMNRLMLEAGRMQLTGGQGADGAAVMLARKLTTR